jgi:opacity protein-like surface antigen
MNGRSTGFIAMAVAVVTGMTILGGSAEAVSRRIDRPGTVSIGGGASYGIMVGNARYGLDFDSGLGYNVVLRYALDRKWMLGFHFQNQTYDAISGLDYGEDVPLDPPDRLVVTTFEGQLYYYLRQGTDSRNYALVGLGVYRPEIRYDERTPGVAAVETASFPGENLMMTAGLGVELFLRENWALDLTGRVLGYYGSGIADQEFEFLESTGDISFGLHARVGLLYFLSR